MLFALSAAYFMDLNLVIQSLRLNGLDDDEVDYFVDTIGDREIADSADSLQHSADDDIPCELLDVIEQVLSELSLSATLAESIMLSYDRLKKMPATEHTEALDKNQCELCERYAHLTVHHLLPKSEHKRVIKRGLFTQLDCERNVIRICRICHNACHQYIENRSMADYYHTVDRLLENELLLKFVKFRSKA